MSLLFTLIACGGAEAPAPATPAAPAAPPEVPAELGQVANATQHVQEEGKSMPFTLVIGLSPEAEKLRQEKNERIAVSVTVNDGIGGDDGTYREKSFELGSEGRILEVPGIEITTVKEGSPALSEFAVNVYSARKSAPENLLNCEFLGGPLKDIGPKMNIQCKPL